jgi:hypothetical protein
MRIYLSTDHGVTTSLPLQIDLALDGLVGRRVVGMEEGRSVVSFDHRDRPAGPEKPPETSQRLDRPGEVLKDETDEDVVERLGRERQREDVGLAELHVCQSGPIGPPSGLGDGVCGDVHRRELCLRAS